MLMEQHYKDLEKKISERPLVVGKLLWEEHIIATTSYDEMDQQDDNGSSMIMNTIYDIFNKGKESLKKLLASVLLYHKETASTAEKILSEGNYKLFIYIANCS